jgi:hypothetical protein
MIAVCGVIPRRLASAWWNAPVDASARAQATARGAWVLAAVAAFAVYLRLARSRAVNSDGSAQALQAWEMLHGNLLLRGWRTTDVSFYATELPEYMLVEVVRGLGQDVVHVAAAITYTLVVLLAALVAKGTATGRPAAARVALAAGIMLAPQLDSGTNVLLSSPDHIGTSVPILAAWLVIDRARPRWYVPVIVSLLLAWATVADSVVLVAGILPLACVCAFRVARGAKWFEIALGGGAIIAAGVAQAVVDLIHALGGYTARPLGPQFASLGEIFWHNLPIAGQCLLLLPGADFLGLPAGPATFFVVLHLAGVALAAAGIALAALRFLRFRLDLVGQVLLAGIVINLLAFVVTTRVYAASSAREIAPVLPFAAALAGRQLARHAWPRGTFAGRAALPVLGVVLAGYVAGLGLELTTPAAPPLAAQLTTWLEKQRLGTGLSGPWEATVVALTSANRVAVHPVAVIGDRVIGAPWGVKPAWYDPGRSAANFVVLFPGIPGYPGFTARQAVLATFGAPARTYHVGQYAILYWPTNLLTKLGSGLVHPFAGKVPVK